MLARARREKGKLARCNDLASMGSVTMVCIDVEKHDASPGVELLELGISWTHYKAGWSMAEGKMQQYEVYHIIIADNCHLEQEHMPNRRYEFDMGDCLL